MKAKPKDKDLNLASEEYLFAQTRPDIFCHTPLKNSKGACEPNWSVKKPKNEEVVMRWLKESTAIGILLGPLSGGLVCLDLDNFDEKAYAIADKILPPTGLMSGKDGDLRRHRYYVIINSIFDDSDLPGNGTAVRRTMDDGKMPRFAGTRHYKLRNKAGIDFIGAGGQVGAPPSIYGEINGKPVHREWYGEKPGIPLEIDYYELKAKVEKLAQKLGWKKRTTKKVASKAAVISTTNNNGYNPTLSSDFESYSYQLSEMIPAVEGDGGYMTTYAACCLAGDYNIPIEKAWPELQKYNLRCEPPWDEKELYEKLQASYISRQEPIGCKLVNEEDKWREGLIYSESKDVKFLTKNNFNNAVRLIQNLPELRGRISYDIFSSKIIVRDEVPWDNHSNRNFTNEDIQQLRYYLANHVDQFEANAKLINEAIEKVAADNPFHPVRSYIEHLPKWDGVERIERLFPDYLGTDDNRYTRFLGLLLCSGAITRIYEPGAKFDYVIVLEGEQGTGKSTLVKTLACSEEWFAELNGDLSNKDSMELLRGYWFIEIAELYSYTKSNIDSVKSFVSRNVDKFRPPYHYRTEEYPRQSIFIATTNQRNYLRDTTGNRRFLPIRTSNINLKLLREDIQQIWAEAKCYYDLGMLKLHIDDPEIEQVANMERIGREMHYAWKEKIEQYLEEKDLERISTNELLTECLGLTKDNNIRRHEKQLKTVMQHMQWDGPKDFCFSGKTLKGYEKSDLV